MTELVETGVLEVAGGFLKLITYFVSEFHNCAELVVNDARAVLACIYGGSR